jgi:hypothetical protein
MGDGGVYGEPLLAFQEQLQEINYYDMPPLQETGYGPRQSYGTIRGVMQTSESRIKQSNGNLVLAVVRFLWTDEMVIAGKFIQGDDGVIYRVVADNDWTREGGFTRFTLEKLVGANGDDTLDPGMSVGTGNFS